MGENNNIRKIAKSQGRKLVYLARKIGKQRDTFNLKINADRFTPDERATLCRELGVSMSELFPASIEGTQ